MSRTKHQKNLPSRPYIKGGRFLGFTKLWFFKKSTPLLFALAPLWPCPEFGECRFQLVLGSCQIVTSFEYSRRLHTVGNAPFWQSDEPKPCLLTARIGRSLIRKTFDVDRCDDILKFYHQAAHSPRAQKTTATDVYNCDSSLAGRLTAVHPEVSFFDGNWRPLTREAFTLSAYKDCRAVRDENTLVCPGLYGDERNWLVDYLNMLSWSVSTEPLNEKKSKPRTLILAPGDRRRDL